MRVTRIALLRLMVVLMGGVSSAFERWTFRSLRRSGDNRGSEIGSREHEREQATQEFDRHASRLSREPGAIKRPGPHAPTLVRLSTPPC